jgi:hypothetical protein
LYKLGTATPKRWATAASISRSYPEASATFAASATTTSGVRPALGTGDNLAEELEHYRRDDLGILRLRVVAGFRDHDHLSAQAVRNESGLGEGAGRGRSFLL